MLKTRNLQIGSVRKDVVRESRMTGPGSDETLLTAMAHDFKRMSIDASSLPY